MFSTSLALFLGAVMSDAAVVVAENAVAPNCSAIIVTNETTKQDCLKAGECTYAGECSSYLDGENCKCVDGRVKLNATEGYGGKLTGEECEKCHGYVADLEVKDAMNKSSKTTCVAKCEDFTEKEACSAKLGCYFKEDPLQYGKGKCETTCKSNDGEGLLEDACSKSAYGCRWIPDTNSQYQNKGECKFVAGDKCASDEDCASVDSYSQCTGKVGKKECTCQDKYVSDNGVCKGEIDAACTHTNGCSGDNVCYKSDNSECVSGDEECAGTCKKPYVASGAGSTQNFVESSYSSAAPTSLVVLFVALFCSA